MNWEPFHDLIIQFADEKKINREQFIESWRLMQRYMGFGTEKCHNRVQSCPVWVGE
jgi:hypothetical protein